MKRVSLYVLIPYALTAISFDTVYFDAFILTVIITSILNFIRRKRIVISLFILFFTSVAFFNCASLYSLCNKSFYPIIDKQISLTCVVDSTPSYNKNDVQFTADMMCARYNGKNIDLNEKFRFM